MALNTFGMLMDMVTIRSTGATVCIGSHSESFSRLRFPRSQAPCLGTNLLEAPLPDSIGTTTVQSVANASEEIPSFEKHGGSVTPRTSFRCRRFKSFHPDYLSDKSHRRSRRWAFCLKSLTFRPASRVQMASCSVRVAGARSLQVVCLPQILVVQKAGFPMTSDVGSDRISPVSKE
jgi:hypothetical protein